MPLRDRLRKYFGDPALLGLVFALSIFGVLMVYSAGQLDAPDARVMHVWKQQIMWLLIAIGLMCVIVRIPIQWFEWAAIPAYVIGIIALLATLVIGVGKGTAASTKSWLEIGPVAVQPSQFMNIATILMLARVMGSRREPPNSLAQLWAPLAIAGLPFMLVMAQPDLGTAMVFGAALIATMYWSGVPGAMMFMLISPMLALFLSMSTWVFSVYMLLILVFLMLYRPFLWESVTVVVVNLVAGTIRGPLWNSLEPYQQARLVSFLDPSVDPRGSGYQLIQSQVAIGSGGLFGKGWLEGSQKRLAFLPEQHTDFIFSVIGEELGFLFGTLPVLIVFGLILWRLVRIAERVADPFAGIVIFGVFGAWFAHVFVNVGMTIGLMPITGIPLPFLSYGGSFLLATYIATGIVQRAAAEHSRRGIIS